MGNTYCAMCGGSHESTTAGCVTTGRESGPVMEPTREQIEAKILAFTDCDGADSLAWEVSVYRLALRALRIVAILDGIDEQRARHLIETCQHEGEVATAHGLFARADAWAALARALGEVQP